MQRQYVGDPFRPVYVECRAAWDDDLAIREHIWALCRNLPETKGGFDPTLTWGAMEVSSVVMRVRRKQEGPGRRRSAMATEGHQSRQDYH
jgi:hypothetical protein